MFVCEHDPVYTNGRRAKDLDNEQLRQRFKALGAEYYQVGAIPNCAIRRHACLLCQALTASCKA